MALLKSFAAVLPLFLKTSVQGITIFNEQTPFLSAAGLVTIESFEDAPLIGSETSGALTSLNLNFLTVSSTPTAVKVLGAPLSNGNHNTTIGGSRYLTFDTDQGSVSADATLGFIFPQPVSAFGLFLIDAEEGVSIRINGLDYLVAPTSDGGSNYFGIIIETPFTTVFLDAGVNDSQWSIDDIAVTQVPEPTSPILIIAGLGALTRWRRHY